jgi:hypothetical protein
MVRTRAKVTKEQIPKGVGVKEKAVWYEMWVALLGAGIALGSAYYARVQAVEAHRQADAAVEAIRTECESRISARIDALRHEARSVAVAGALCFKSRGKCASAIRTAYELEQNLKVFAARERRKKTCDLALDPIRQLATLAGRIASLSLSGTRSDDFLGTVVEIERTVHNGNGYLFLLDQCCGK